MFLLFLVELIVGLILFRIILMTGRIISIMFLLLSIRVVVIPNQMSYLNPCLPGINLIFIPYLHPPSI